MPYGLRKLPDKDLYRVFNKDTGEIHAKETTKGNALKQIRLLYMLERKKGGEISYPKLEQSLEQDSSVSGNGCCAKCEAIEGNGKPLASKTFIPPYQPTGNYMTPWRWVLYKERELQNSTYANMMKDPSVKALYYKLKEKAGDNFNVDWLETNYMKNRKGIKKEPKPKETKQDKIEKSLKGTKKITEFF